MLKLPAELYYAEIEASTASLAALAEYADPMLPIPSCPDWTLSQLVAHLGRAQRRAAEIVATRATGPIDIDLVPDVELPADLSARGRWLTAGAARLTGALREAYEAEVWAFGSIRPASIWVRRMANETMVHAADAGFAAGEEVSMAPELAADAIDEWLTLLSGPIFGRPDPRAAVLPVGASLQVQATDSELGDAGEWLVTHEPDGVRVTNGQATAIATAMATATVALSGPAAAVLLVLLGHYEPSGWLVRVSGDATALDRWLKGTRF
jgi:uncharacterized protein (TIGR03083 family)